MPIQLTTKQVKGLKEIARLARKGATYRPQIRLNYYRVNDKGEMCSCFLGAVAEAAYGMADIDAVPSVISKLEDKYDLGHKRLPLPAEEGDGSDSGTMFALVAYLNDKVGYTREQIADYLEKLANEAEVVNEPGN